MAVKQFSKIADLVRILRQPVILGLLILVALSVSRLILVALFWDRVSATAGLAFILLQGIRFDIILIGMLIGPVLLFKPLFHTRRNLITVGRWIWPLYLALITSFAFFVEASTVSFIEEFDSRPNYTFVEYLGYPKEVFATLAGSYLLALVLFTTVAVLLFWLVFRWNRNDPAAEKVIPGWLCFLSFPLVAVLVLMMVRSSLGHHPANPSIAAFSADSMVNQLPLNSPYSLLYAIYGHHRDDKDKQVRYGRMAEQEVFDLILADAGIDKSRQIGRASPTLHRHQATSRPGRPQNIVIIMEESLGAEFVGSLGGVPVTPNLDAAGEDGIWFERLYATGTRSVRGIEAVLTGITPMARSSVVKLMETQQNFFTLAGLLKDQGYATSFLYGGEAHFDNMKRFFLNNGIQTVIDQGDFTNPEYVGTWGVSDEDLLRRADQTFRQAGDRPFFSFVFTSTHHKPFDIPANKVTPESGPDGIRQTAVKYADYALGKFLELAKASDYWENTLFLIIADHNSRVYGSHLVPIERFRIPGVILGGQVEPRRVPGITSQMDMLPTLLSLAGISADIPAIGRDLTSVEFKEGAGRAVMQFYKIAAFMVPGRVVVMQPDLPAASFLYEFGGVLQPDPNPDPNLEKLALAYAWFAPLMIRNQWYQAQAPK